MNPEGFLFFRRVPAGTIICRVSSRQVRSQFRLRASSFWHGPKGTKSPLRVCASGSTSAPRAGLAHSRPPPKNPRFTGAQNRCKTLLTGVRLLTPPATHGGPRPFADLPYNLLRRLWAPTLGVQACGPASLTAHYAEGPRPARRPDGVRQPKHTPCRSPEGVVGTDAAAGQGRRKETDAPQLSGGYPGGPPPGHALWVLSLVQEKVPRLSGRDPTNPRACRNPPAKRYQFEGGIPRGFGGGTPKGTAGSPQSSRAVS